MVDAAQFQVAATQSRAVLMACDVRFRAGLSFGQSRSERISLAIGRQIVTSLTAGTLQLRGHNSIVTSEVRVAQIKNGFVGSSWISACRQQSSLSYPLSVIADFLHENESHWI